MNHCNWRHRLAALATLGLAACGGGSTGDASPAAYDLTGYWQLYLTPTGTTTEVGPMPVYIGQTGGTFGGVDVSGSMTGAAFSLNASGGTFQVALTGLATSADSAAGTVAFTGSVSGNGTFRLERFTPTGTMDATGSLDGNTINATSTSAVGVRTYADAALTMLTSVSLVLADEDIDLQVLLPAAGLVAGTHSVPGTIAAEILFRIDGTVVSAVASGGSVTVTQYDASGITGSYSLTTSVGTVTGFFDVDFDVEEYDP